MSAVVDQGRFEQEWAADLDVLSNLARNGDVASVARTVDVSFVGTKALLDPLVDGAAAWGFEFGQFEEVEDPEDGEDWRLDLDIVQSAEPEAIKALTRKCLEIETAYPGIRYDGWGCAAQTGSNS